MSSFSEKLHCSKVGDNVWMVERPFSFDYKEQIIVVVPDGFITDFASVPRIFWALLPPDGRYSQAAVVHDKLYQSQEQEREVCDKIFYEGMKVLGVNKITREIMYWAVRIFGNLAWQNYIKDMKSC